MCVCCVCELLSSGRNLMILVRCEFTWFEWRNKSSEKEKKREKEKKMNSFAFVAQFFVHHYEIEKMRAHMKRLECAYLICNPSFASMSSSNIGRKSIAFTIQMCDWLAVCLCW